MEIFYQPPVNHWSGEAFDPFDQGFSLPKDTY